MDSSADTAAWVAAIAAVASLGIVAAQFFGGRSERVRLHDVDTLERMLQIITDPQVAMNTPWDPSLFTAIYITLSPSSRRTQKTFRQLSAASPDKIPSKAQLVQYSTELAADLMVAIRHRVGVKG